MSLDAIRLHADAARWAMARLFASAEGLTTEQWRAPGHAGNGSIHTTLIHIIETQRSWYTWFDGSNPDPTARVFIDGEVVHDLAAVREQWEISADQVAALLGRLSEDEARAPWPMEFPNRPAFTLPLWQLLLHVANHGTQHRSEVAAMLTEHGHSPGHLDMLFYYVDTYASENAGGGR